MPDRCNTGHGLLYWARMRHHFLNKILLELEDANAHIHEYSCITPSITPVETLGVTPAVTMTDFASILDGFTAGCLHARGAHRIQLLQRCSPSATTHVDRFRTARQNAMYRSCCGKTCALLLCPLVVVLLLIYLVLAYVLSVLLTLLYIPRLFAVQKLYW